MNKRRLRTVRLFSGGGPSGMSPEFAGSNSIGSAVTNTGATVMKGMNPALNSSTSVSSITSGGAADATSAASSGASTAASAGSSTSGASTATTGATTGLFGNVPKIGNYPVTSYLGAALGALLAYNTFTSNSQINDTSYYHDLYDEFGNLDYEGDYNTLISLKLNAYLGEVPSVADIRGMNSAAKVGSAATSAFSGAMAGAGFGVPGMVIGALVGLGASAAGSAAGDAAAEREHSELESERSQALADNLTNFLTAMKNEGSRINMEAARNITAYGGPISIFDTGGIMPMQEALQYSQMFQNVGSGYRPQNKVLTPTTQYEIGSLGRPVQQQQFAFGGDIMSNGGDFSTGMMHVNAGDTHEVNPYEGVPMGSDEEGTPNLVEQGETVYDDYVYSNRLIVPEQHAEKGEKLTQEQKVLNKFKGMTYANAAKKAEHQSGVDERPNDAIARRGFESTLLILANSQEKEREIQNLDEREEGIEQKKLALRDMSDEEFVAMKLLQEEQQAQQLALMEQLVLAQQLQQPSPEEMQAMQQLVMLLQAMLQQGQPLIGAYGGYFAEGGLMSPEELQAMLAQAELQQAEQQQSAQAEGEAQQRLLQDLTTEQPQTEEAPKQELTGIDKGTPADEMSTSELNETIDLIYQWAKANGDKELAKRARKAKRASREAKEDFVDEALEDIDAAEQQKTAEQGQEEVQEEGNTNEQSQLAALALALMELQALDQSSEQAAALELNAQMAAGEGQAFAMGGSTEDEFEQSPEDRISMLNSFMQGLATSLDELSLQIYNTFKSLLSTGKQDDMQKAYQMADLVYAMYKSNNSYAMGGSMNLNNANAGNTVGSLKVFAGINPHKEYALTTAEKYSDFLKYLQENGLSLQDYVKYYSDNNNGAKWFRKKYDKKEVNKWIQSINDANKESTAKQYLGALNYDLLKVVADKLGINTKDIVNDTNRETNYRNAILKANKNYTEYADALKNYATLVYRDKDWDATKNATWTDSATLKIKSLKSYQSDFFKGDNALSDLDAYYEKRLSNFLKDKKITGWQKNDKVASNFHLSGAQARDFNNYLIGTGDAQDAELAKLFRMSHSDNASWDSDSAWEYKNKFTPDGTVTESNDYKTAFASVPQKVDGQWGRRHSPKLDAIYEYTPAKERNAYYIGDQEIDPSLFLDTNGNWTNHIWKAVAAGDESKDGYITHKFNLTLNEIPLIADASTAVKTDEDNDPFPLAANWPYGLAAGMQGLALGYNLVTPVDFSNADLIMDAANLAGKYKEVKAPVIDGLMFREVPDTRYGAIQAQAVGAATNDFLHNTSNGNRANEQLGFIRNNYATQTAMADSNIKNRLQYFDNELKRKGFNAGIKEENAKNYLLAALANQSAFQRAVASRLEGVKAAATMRLAAQDAKSAAVSAGIKGLTDLGLTYALNENQNDILGWGIRNNAWGPIRSYSNGTNITANGGKIRLKRNISI